MVKCENCGKKVVSLHRHSFPADIREEKTFCVCIPWETMEQCINLSLSNAKRLVNDAVYLLKSGRLSSAKVLAILSLEESGKALLACVYLAEKKKISVNDYKREFLNHKTKINEALKAIEKIYIHLKINRKMLSRNIAKELQEDKLQSIFVDYDGRFQMWDIPWSQNPHPLANTYHEFMDLKSAEALREGQEPIDKAYTEMLIKMAKTAIYCARQRRDKNL